MNVPSDLRLGYVIPPYQYGWIIQGKLRQDFEHAHVSSADFTCYNAFTYTLGWDGMGFAGN